MEYSGLLSLFFSKWNIIIKYFPDHKGSQEFNYEGKKKKEIARHSLRMMLPGSPGGQERRFQSGFKN